MHILLVNAFHFRGGGDSTYTFNLAELLRANGHEVAFFGMQGPRNIPDKNDDLFVSNIDYKELNRHKNLVGGLKVLRHAFYSSEARDKFSRLLDRFRPDILHLQNFMPQMSPSIVLEAKRRRLPIVWTLHDYGLVCPNTNFWIDSQNKICHACLNGHFLTPLLKRCKKKSLLASALLPIYAAVLRAFGIRDKIDAFLAPSVFLRSKLLEAGIQGNKVLHLPLFLPDSQFAVSSSDQGYILFLGRPTAMKGIFPLLDACRLVPEIQLIIAGRVDDELEGQLSALRPYNAHFVGLKQGQELRTLLINASAVIVPSLCFENQPFSILEAFACAKPVIASDLGGMRELVTHGERGLLVPPGNTIALAEAIRWILSHPSEAARMGGAAKLYACAHHRAADHYRQLSAIYSQVSSAWREQYHLFKSKNLSCISSHI